ncbi:MAG: amidohydrolase [Chromatiales bacterium]|nr:MAG: amidohydrolase [Chromatiales bacterium]
MQNLTITLAQADLHWHDPPANRRMFADLAADCASATDLIVLPEMFTTGFTMEAAQVAEDMDGDTVRWMAELARDLDVTLTGSLVIRDGDQFFNRLVWMPPDGQVAHYDKRHLFRMADEQDHYAQGKERRIFQLRDWRICPLVCYDLRFPVWSRGVNEFELLLYVANWPAARRSAWQTLLPARAVENLCYCAGVNRVGTDGRDVAYVGSSGAWDHLGRTVAECGDQHAMLTVELDGAALQRYREKFPAHLDADRFELAPD